MNSGDRYDRFIVKYRDDSAAHSSPAALQRSLQAMATPRGRGNAMALKRLHRIATGADVVSVDRGLDRVEAESLMRQFAADPGVEYVEVDHIVRPALTPNDPRYRRQWSYWGNNGIDADEAWDLSDGSGTVVAVLDTGITRHSDLDENVRPGYDFISSTRSSNDGDGRDGDPSDPGDWERAGQCGEGRPARASSWHGTHVAGTIAAVTNNGKGVAGVAHSGWIVPVRVLGTCGGHVSDVADAIIWASGGAVAGVPENPYPAEVLNLSLSHRASCGRTYQRAIDSAVSRGTTIVVAAGNESADVAGSSPASCDNVIAVAATTRPGRRAGFSNYGGKVDVAAPGSHILSTLNSGSTRPETEIYGTRSGTSMAAPHVTGVVAIIQSVAGTPKTPAQVEALVKSTAKATRARPSRPIGAGIVNAKAALDATIAPLPPVPVD
ncbi:S8 family peptidase [Lysobacter sp. S4-A87]|uniref:S8 family peptidase n=1 Tax=Lysobacter sp. S4-A87 TaxID=2925843 RepID=UPI001F531A31|nr:S8 family peptidase [Lysobacter sp. S4-A87]UNK49126.1 S8 family peptidase [Lysobacter sp. S4-A87]